MKLTLKIPKSTLILIGISIVAVASVAVADYTIPLTINVERDINNTYVQNGAGGNTSEQIEAVIGANDSYTRTYNVTYDALVAGGDGYEKDTNATTECNGDTTYLDGDGNCDDISLVYYFQESDLTAVLNDNYAPIAVVGNTSEQIESVIGSNSSYTATNTSDQMIAATNSTYLNRSGDSVTGNVVFNDGAWLGVGGVPITYATIFSDVRQEHISGENDLLIVGQTHDQGVALWYDAGTGDSYVGSIYNSGDLHLIVNARGTGAEITAIEIDGGTGYVDMTTGACVASNCITSWNEVNLTAAGDGFEADTNASTGCAGDTTYLSGAGNCNDLDAQYIELGDNFAGEVTGTYGATVLDHNALDDQYYDSESDLTGLLDDNYAPIGGIGDPWVNTTGDTMTGDLEMGTNNVSTYNTTYGGGNAHIYWNGTNLVIEG